MSLSLSHLIRTGPTLYAWNTSTGSDIDVKSIDPSKKTYDSHGRACIGIQVGVAGDLVCTVDSGQNIFFKGLTANSFLPVRAKNIVADGYVMDAAVALTSVTTTFAGGGGPATAAAIVTAINAAVHSAVASVPASGTGAVASTDGYYITLTPSAGTGSLKLIGGTGLAQLGIPSQTNTVMPYTGVVDFSVAANLAALAGLTLIIGVAPRSEHTSTAADLVIYWEI